MMVDKTGEFSLERIFYILGNGQMPVTPEKIIVYGIFFICVVIFVNWLLSVTVIVLKPFLYAVLMIAVVRPELIHYLTNEEAVIRCVETAKSLLVSVSLGLVGFMRLTCEQFTQGRE